MCERAGRATLRRRPHGDHPADVRRRSARSDRPVHVLGAADGPGRRRRDRRRRAPDAGRRRPRPRGVHRPLRRARRRRRVRRRRAVGSARGVPRRDHARRVPRGASSTSVARRWTRPALDLPLLSVDPEPPAFMTPAGCRARAAGLEPRPLAEPAAATRDMGRRAWRAAVEGRSDAGAGGRAAGALEAKPGVLAGAERPEGAGARSRRIRGRRRCGRSRQQQRRRGGPGRRQGSALRAKAGGATAKIRDVVRPADDDPQELARTPKDAVRASTRQGAGSPPTGRHRASTAEAAALRTK